MKHHLTIPCSRCGEAVTVEVTSIREGRYNHYDDEPGALTAEEWEAWPECACCFDGHPQPDIDQSQVDDALNAAPDLYDIRRDARTEAADDAADAKYRASIGD
jgi:hypothetical protein